LTYFGFPFCVRLCNSTEEDYTARRLIRKPLGSEVIIFLSVCATLHFKARLQRLMDIRLTLQPGQRGTKRLVEQYGEQLVCVRYRYDARRKRRFTTVELIVAEQPWQAKPKPPAPPRLVLIRLARGERDLQRRVKAAGGEWLEKQQLWRLAHDQVLTLGLSDRIQSE
jgi:hypothetical protein